MVEKRAEFILMGFSQYGLGFQLISDSLYIESKGLLAKPILRLPSVDPNLDWLSKDGIARMFSGLRNVDETHAYDQFLRDVSLREVGLGHIRTGIKFAEAIHHPFTKFKTLLLAGSRFRLPNQEAEEALVRARTIPEELGSLHERVEALAWSSWIDKQLGKDESFAFDGADIAYRQLLEQVKARFDRGQLEITTQTMLEDVCTAGCTMAQIAVTLDRDPKPYLRAARKAASDMTSWSEFVPSYINIVQTEKALGQDHRKTLARLKQRITVEDTRIRGSTIHFWLQVIDLEKTIGDGWEKTLEYVRRLCNKLNFPLDVAEGYAYLAEFEARNDIDPTEAFRKAKKVVKESAWYDKVRIMFVTKSKIDAVERYLLIKELLSGDAEQELPTEEELEEVLTTVKKKVAERVSRIGRYRDRDRQVEAYLTLASELTFLGANTLDFIDLAKCAVYGSSRPDSYVHRLKILGRYQRNIGGSLHTSACAILAQATSEEIQHALLLALQTGDNYALIGIGAFIPRENHEQIIQIMDASVQNRVRSSFSYGAVLTQ